MRMMCSDMLMLTRRMQLAFKGNLLVNEIWLSGQYWHLDIGSDLRITRPTRILEGWIPRHMTKIYDANYEIYRTVFTTSMLLGILMIVSALALLRMKIQIIHVHNQTGLKHAEYDLGDLIFDGPPRTRQSASSSKMGCANRCPQ